MEQTVPQRDQYPHEHRSDDELCSAEQNDACIEQVECSNMKRSDDPCEQAPGIAVWTCSPSSSARLGRAWTVHR